MIQSVYHDPAFPVSAVEKYDPEGWIADPTHERHKLKYLERLAEAYRQGRYMEPIWVCCTSQYTYIDTRVGGGRYYAMVKLCAATEFPAIVQNFDGAKKPHRRTVQLTAPEQVAAYYTAIPLPVKWECDEDGNLMRMSRHRCAWTGWDKFPLLPGEDALPPLPAHLLNGVGQ